MEFLITSICGLLGIAILGAVLLLPLRYKFITELKRKSRKELEDLVFRFEAEYFDYLGCENEDVVKFKTLVETKNISELRKNWKRFSQSLQKLERKAGHRGGINHGLLQLV